MVAILRVPVEWNGLGGLPGLSVFYRTGGAGVDVSSLTAFYTAIRTLVPTALSWTIPNSGDELDSDTGELIGGWTATGGGTVIGTGGVGAYPAGTGARVRWHTTTIVNGRRLAGSTFLCPLITAAYDASGTVASSAQATIQSAADALVASGVAWQVWHRPVAGVGGVVGAFNTATVPDRVSSLRTRRS